MRIQQLLPYIANQIAAGEVVERPASVVKELLENSLDAQADYIELEIEKGGLKRIQVTDNGKGIHQADLLLAVQPHATSKLQNADDLFNIRTLGFRGEALASISSIARLQITSSQDIDAGAWRVRVAGGELPHVEPAAHPLGTTVLVEDLFFNTPARRKFLRSDKAEFNQIEEIFKRIVLSNYQIGFGLKYNQRVIYQLPAAMDAYAQEKRISKIFGKQFLQHAVKIEFAVTGISLRGWVGLPSHTRSQADLQYIYLNGRIIRDKVVNHAVRTAYEDTVYPGRYPLFLLYLEIEANRVDVNVHPTKHEVRFHDSRLVHDFIYQSVLASLSKQPEAMQQSTQASISLNAKPYEFPAQNLYQVNEQITASYRDKVMKIAMLYEHYVFVQQAGDLLVIDLHQALFIMYFIELQQGFLQKNVPTKALLIPVVKALNADQITVLERHLALLDSLGIHVSILSSKQVILRAIPTYFSKVHPEKFLSALCQELVVTFDDSEQADYWLKVAAKVASRVVELNETIAQTVVDNFTRLSTQQIVNEKFYHLITPTLLNKLVQQ